MMVVQRESNEVVFCRCIHVEAIILVGQSPVAGVFNDFGSDIAEREASFLWGVLQWTDTIDMFDLFCILLTPPFHLHHHSSIPSLFYNTNTGSSLIWWHLSPGPQANTKECRVGLNRVQSHYSPSVVYSILRCLRWDVKDGTDGGWRSRVINRSILWNDEMHYFWG